MDGSDRILLREINRVERSNIEFKCRTIPIEIAAGEHTCHMFSMWFKFSGVTLLAGN